MPAVLVFVRRDDVLNIAVILIVVGASASLLAALASFFYPHRLWWKVIAVLTVCEIALGIVAAVMDKLGFSSNGTHR